MANVFDRSPLGALADEWEKDQAQRLPEIASRQPSPRQGLALDDAPAAEPSAPADSRAPATSRSSGGTSIQPPTSLVPLFQAASRKYRVPVNVLAGMAAQESGFDPSAVGEPTKWGRAKGLMQYLDATADGLGINPLDPEQAIDAAAKQLRERLDRGYKMPDAVREHFAGPDRKQWGAKTRQYWFDVRDKMGQLDRNSLIPPDFSNVQGTPGATPAEGAPAQSDRGPDYPTSQNGPLPPNLMFSEGERPWTPEELAEIAEFRKKAAEGPTFGENMADAGRALGIGVDNLALNVRELTGRIPVVGEPIVRGLDAADRFISGRGSEEILQGNIKQYQENMTPQMQAAMKKKWWDEEKGEFGPAFTDWRSYTGGLLQSAPETAITMFPAIRVGKAVYAANIARGATAAVAAQASARAATIAGSIGEGALGGAAVAREVREQIMALPDDVAAKSEAIQGIIRESGGAMSVADAKRQLAEDQASLGFVAGGIATGAFGGMGDRAIAKILGEKIAGGAVRRAMIGAARGAVGEGLLEEAPQSAATAAITNYAVGEADPTRTLGQGVLNETLGGTVLGSAMGGPIGAATGLASPQDAANQPPPATEPPIPGDAPRSDAITPDNEGLAPAGAPPAPPAAPPPGPMQQAVNRVAEARAQAAAAAPMRQQRAIFEIPDEGVSVEGTIVTQDENGTLFRTDDGREFMVHAGDNSARITPVGAPTAPDAQTVTAEPVADTVAQVEAIRDPSSGKDAAIITPASSRNLPEGALKGLAAIETDQGLFVTSNPEKAAAVAAAGGTLTTDQVGELLGYTTPKAETDGTVVQATDAAGNVVHEEATNAANLADATARAEEMAPEGGVVGVTDAVDALNRREASVAAERQGVPMMVTRAMREQLAARGITPEQIGKLTPQQAWEILNAPAEPGPSASAQVPLAERSDADLRARLKFLHGRAKLSGWNKYLLDERRAVEAEIDRRAGAAQETPNEVRDDGARGAEAAAPAGAGEPAGGAADAVGAARGQPGAEGAAPAVRADVAGADAAGDAQPALKQVFTGKTKTDGKHGASIGSLADGTRRQLMVDPDGGYFWGDYKEASDIRNGGDLGSLVVEGEHAGFTPATFGSSAEARAAAESTPQTKKKPAGKKKPRAPHQMPRAEFERDAAFQGVNAATDEENPSYWFTDQADEARKFAEAGRGEGAQARTEPRIDVALKSDLDSEWKDSGRSSGSKHAYTGGPEKKRPIVASIPLDAASDPHRYLVEQAIKNGETISDEVLADYPDLKAKAANDAQPALTDPHAGKWFGSREKADAYLAKKKAGGTHEVVQTGKVRFEIKPRAAAAQVGADLAAQAEITARAPSPKLRGDYSFLNDTQDPLAQASAEAATSPANDRPEPTDAQKEAGNYAKGHIRIGGLDISIENPAGTRRNPEWPPLEHAYGYVRGSEGADGDHVDVFLGEQATDTARPVYVIDQVNEDGSFDEHKAVMGFTTAKDAKAAYLANYEDGWNGFGGMRKMAFEEFRDWVLDTKHTRKPVSSMVAARGEPKVEGTSRQEQIDATLAAGGRAVDNELRALNGQAVMRLADDELAAIPADRRTTSEDIQRRRDEAHPPAGSSRAPSGSVPPGTAPETNQTPTAGNEGQGAQPTSAPELRATPLRDDFGNYSIPSGAQLVSQSGRALAPAPKWDAETPRKRTLSLSRQRAWLVDEAVKESDATGGGFQTGMLRRIDPTNFSRSDFDTVNDVLFGEPDGPKPEHFRAAAPAKAPAKPKPAPAGDRVTEALRAMADGRHPEQVLSGMGSEDIRAVATAMGFKPKAGASDAAMAERISSEARADWIKAAQRALDASPAPARKSVTVAKSGPGVTAIVIDPSAGMAETVPMRWVRSSADERREMLRQAGYTDGDQARVFAAREWADLSETVQQAVEAAARPAAPAAHAIANSSFGANNTLISRERAAELLARLKAKSSQFNAGIDPELLAIGAELAAFYIEGGARKFSDFARAIAADLDQSITSLRPYLRAWYNAARDLTEDAGLDISGMNTPDEVRAELAALVANDQGDTNEQQQRVRTEDGADAAGRDQDGAEGGAEGPGAGGARGDAEPRAAGDLFGQPDADGGGDAAGDRGGDPGRGAGDRRPGEDRAAGERDAGGGDGSRDGAGDRGDRRAERPAAGGSAGRRAEPVRADGPVSAPRDYRIQPGELERRGGWKATAERNIEIVELVKRLEAEGRQATDAERAQLTRFTGWGASEIANGVFPDRYGRYKDGWQDLGERLKAALTENEYEAARRSTQYAHYTSEGVIRSIFGGLERLGFGGGSVLEPGMGVGLFRGLMPDGMAGSSQYTGVEYDPITGAIARHLYPASNVIVGDFTRTKLPKDFFNAAIGNPPFSQTRITNDPEYKKQGFLLHDYFFAKTMDRVKPGGLVVFVTSKGTMDKANDRARKYLADRADLVGAVRLPQTAFKDNAGTDVVTDVLFLRKRLPGEEPGGAGWLGLAEVRTPQGPTQVNEYFAANPEMVLGDHSLTGKMYGRDSGASYTVTPRAGDIEEQFAAAVQRLPEGIYRPGDSERAAVAAARDRDFNPSHKKEGGLYVADDGRLMLVESGAGAPATERPGSSGKPVKLTPKNIEWLKGWTGVRDALKRAQLDQLTDGNWQASLKALNKAYGDFTKKYGPILAFSEITRTDKHGDEVVERRFKNAPLFNMDAEGALAYALEVVHENGEITRGQVLQGRVLKKPAEPKIETTQDALMVQLNRDGRLNLDEVAKLAGTDRETVVAELGSSIYEAPGGGWTTDDDYLSGNVVRKLEEARAAAKQDRRYQRNVDALLAVQPRPLAPSEITVRLGANWVPPSDVEAFSRDTLGNRVDVGYSERLGQWSVAAVESAPSEFGTARMSVADLLDAILNNRQITVRDMASDGKGGRTSVVNPQETEAANDRARKIKEAFGRWLWSDPDRADRLTTYYNEHFNNIVPRHFDGSHLTLPGVTSLKSLHPHQKRVVWRIVQSGDTYMAHGVGAGKTMAAVAAGMEQRRLGLISKPVYVVPNHMLAQFAREFMELYPTANIMVADEQNFHTGNRRRFIAQSALNDPDAIIMTHPSFGRIGMSREFQREYIERQIEEWKAALEETEEGDRITKKGIQQRIEQLERRLEAKMADKAKDQVMTFEELGADYLFVDEAHEFRKLDFATNQGRIKGIDPSGSQRAFDLNMKAEYLRKKRPGRSLTMMSGTPVTNTMGELYTIQRFFQPEQLAEDGLSGFDAWAAQYGDIVTGLEQNAAGGYEQVSRFAKFQNVPELMHRVRSFMDIVTSNQLGELVPRPDVKGGQREIVVTPAEEGYRAYQKTLEARIKAIRERKGQSKPGDDIILNVIGDGRFSAIDMRFVDSERKPAGDSKLDQMLDQVIADYRESADWEYFDPDTSVKDERTGASLMVFTDIGLGEQSSETRGFDMKAWIEKRLTGAGIPREHIAFMRDHKQHAKKEKLFADMRSGKKRILIGGKDMETGVNVQKRLAFLYHLDAPWFPASVEQREGRIIRQGNQNPTVGVRAYATKGSYDSTMWGMNARKQRFIDQAMAGDDSVRSMEDVSESSAFEMAAALASGDERYLKLAGLRGDVERLTRLANAHHDDQRKLRREREAAQDFLGQAGARREALEKAIARRKPIVAGEFEGRVGKDTFDSRDDFSTALYDDFKKLSGQARDGEEKLGEIGGFDIRYVGHLGRGGTYSAEAFVDLPGDPAPLISYPIEPNFAIKGVAARAANQVMGLDRSLSDLAERRETTERRVKALDSRIGAQFPEQADLLEKQAELAELEQELAREQTEQPIGGGLAGEVVEKAAAGGLESIDPAGQTDTSEFKAWFGDSKVVDADGKPLVVYHGTANEFDAFDKDAARSEGGAFYFSNSREFTHPDANAKTYAGKDGRVLPVYLSIENPRIAGVDLPISESSSKAEVDAFLDAVEKFNRGIDYTKNKWLAREVAIARREGNDGLIVRFIEDDRADYGSTIPTTLFIAFEPTQIKSATGNSGAFDPASPSILEAADGSGQADTPATEITPRQAADARRGGRADAEELGLRAAVDKVLGAKVAARVEYMRGYDGLPEHLRTGIQRRIEQRGGRGQTAALYDQQTGRVFVFTNVVRTPDRAVWNALHELAGHHGLRSLLGDRLGQALRVADQNETVSKVADAIARERNIPRENRQLAVEEALAELAAANATGDWDQIQTRYGVEVSEGMRQRVQGAIRNFLRRLRELMDDLFGRPVFTDEDVRQLLDAARAAAIVRGGPPTGGGIGLDATQADQTETAAFKRWFGDSKVVDDAGRPLVVYHGTTASGFEQFNMPAYFSEHAGEASAYTFYGRLAKRERELRRKKYREEVGAELAGTRVPTVGIVADGDTGTVYATDEGVARKNADGSVTIFTGVVQVNDSYEPGDGGTIRLRRGNGREFYREHLRERREWIDRNWPEGEGVGGNVMPVYLSIQNPKRMSAYGANLFGARLGGTREQWETAVRELEAEGYDGIVTDSDDPGFWVNGEASPQQWIPLRPEQIKSATANRGAFDPGSTSILENVEEPHNANAPEDGTLDLDKIKMDRRPISEAVGGALTTVKKAGWLPMTPLNYLSDYARPGMDGVGRYIDVKRDMDAYRGDKHAAYDAHSRDWLAWAAKNPAANAELGAVMHESTIAQVDPSAPYRKGYTLEMEEVARRLPRDSGERARIEDLIRDEPNRRKRYDALHARFEAMPAKAQDLYRSTRDLYKAQADELDQIIEENVGKQLDIARDRAEDAYKAELERIKDDGLTGAARATAEAAAAQRWKEATAGHRFRKAARMMRLRQALEANRLAGPYFPLARFGEYTVAIRGEDGELLSFSRFESPADAAWFAKQARATWPKFKVTEGVISNRDQVRGAVDPNFVADVEEALAGAGAADTVRDEIWQRYLATMPDFSMRKRFIHRKGTPGYHEDAIRAFGSAMFHAAHQMARLKYGPDLTQQVDQIRRQAAASDQPVEAGLLANEFERRHKWVMDPKGGTVAQMISTGAFIWNLSVSPAAAIVNLTQTYMMGAPILGARLGGIARAGAELSRAALQLFSAPRLHLERKLKGPEQAAMHQFYRMGLIDRTQSHSLAGVGEQGVEYSTVREKWMRRLSFMFHHAERVNREVTALAAYRMARRQGQDHEAAIKTASELTWLTHFDYSNSSRARYAQHDVAKVVLIHKQHSMNMTYRLFRDLHQSLKGETPADRRIARAQFVGVMGMHALMAGVKGLPFYGIAMLAAGLLKDAFGDDDDERTPEDMVKAWLYESGMPRELADSILYGAPSVATGLSLYNRIGLPDFFFRSPDKELEGRAEAEYWLQQIMGAGLAIPAQVWSGVNMVRKGDFARGVEQMTPKFVRDVLKAGRYAKEGALTFTGDPIVDEMNAWQIIGQAAGFTPFELSRAYDERNAKVNLQTAINNRRARLMNRYALAYRNDDEEGMAEIEAEFDKFNDAYPEKPITPDGVRRSIRSREARSERNDGGAYIERRLGERINEELGLSQ